MKIKESLRHYIGLLLSAGRTPDDFGQYEFSTVDGKEYVVLAVFRRFLSIYILFTDLEQVGGDADWCMGRLHWTGKMKCISERRAKYLFKKMVELEEKRSNWDDFDDFDDFDDEEEKVEKNSEDTSNISMDITDEEFEKEIAELKAFAEKFGWM